MSFAELSVGEISVWGIVRSGNCPSRNYPSGNCLSGKSLRGTVRQGNIGRGNVRIAPKLSILKIYTWHQILSVKCKVLPAFNLVDIFTATEHYTTVLFLFVTQHLVIDSVDASSKSFSYLSKSQIIKNSKLLLHEQLFCSSKPSTFR